MSPKIEEIILVSDSRIGHITPYSEDDLALIKKHWSAIDAVYGGIFLEDGFWKLTIKTTWFGLRKEITLKKLEMSLPGSQEKQGI